MPRIGDRCWYTRWERDSNTGENHVVAREGTFTGCHPANADYWMIGGHEVHYRDLHPTKEDAERAAAMDILEDL